MKLLVDLVGGQSQNSRGRGIGRYTLSLAEAMARTAGSHEFHVSVTDAFPDSIEPIRTQFASVIPAANFTCWKPILPSAYVDPANEWRMRSTEIIREAWLASLNPDVLHLGSLFEGFGDDATVSLGNFIPYSATGIILHDLIPYIYRDKYLTNKRLEAWYDSRIIELQKAGVLLANSESSRREALDLLGMPEHRVVTISSAAQPIFRPIAFTEAEIANLRGRYGLSRPFVMYTGGIDHRKNIDGLITAFAKLPSEVRKQHQLAIVCSARPQDMALLKSHAKKQGLAEDDFVMTGFVPEDDLVALYNTCKAFCFPSLHEGFGLPALEAMQCGVATIGSNVSSIPEVIGTKDALFDPSNERDFVGRLQQVLTDADYRNALSQHGLEQAKKFSWNESARRAWEAYEDLFAKREQDKKTVASVQTPTRPRLAYISPLPPSRSGIADYSAELLPELQKFYEIDVVSDQKSISDSWIIENCPIRTVDWFKEHAFEYDRIFYHFGNSAFHSHMFALLCNFPGVIVLHDFYLSGIIAHMTIHDGLAGFWERALYDSHGYAALAELREVKDTASVVYKYPTNMPAIRHALGVIVHSEHSKELAREFYGNRLADQWQKVPLLRKTPDTPERAVVREQLGFANNDFVVCSFGAMGRLKLNDRLISAWMESKLSRLENCHLVFVGTEADGDFGLKIRDLIGKSRPTSRIKITGFASPEDYRKYLAAADVAVQLRSFSRGETSAAVNDCMGSGLATIVNSHGAMAELPDDCVEMLEDDFSPAQLAAALETLYADPVKRMTLGMRGKDYVHANLQPHLVAEKYYQVIEDVYSTSPAVTLNKALTRLTDIEVPPDATQHLHRIADALATNHMAFASQRSIFVDISELVQRDSRTGIQRVVRSILMELLKTQVPGYRIEPVYSLPGHEGYYYARSFTTRFLGCPSNLLEDRKIDFGAGDIFVGLDLQHGIPIDQAGLLDRMRRFGVAVIFVVYDLLPIKFPQFFPEVGFSLHTNWLTGVSRSADALMCISGAVAEEVATWMEENASKIGRTPKVGWFHLGADIENSQPSRGMPADSAEVLKILASRKTFLAVGTIEPRKSHAQILEAFEILWQAGEDLNLVLVGKQGWMVEELIERLRDHKELGHRLFWLSNISDEYLEKIYAASNCLIAASQGEGFGLPIIEAASHNRPVIARDIPVFREVAGESSHYFSGMAGEDLANAVRAWLKTPAAKNSTSPQIKILTWKESSGEFLRRVLSMVTELRAIQQVQEKNEDRS
ncbi:glycosyltransferase (plasmid) [Rhizobium sp. CB3090]|uniref:glycosyltransferase n=1 Tax=Rhizobium sp. CB3090 TaxID=3039156 RepID=UPI0024B229C4|nr:glycosyltransferase [Rhizobium sp. CB3090]WFU12162.1 glycosyltransferase [Rhizobium sp. CB3090]